MNFKDESSYMIHFKDKLVKVKSIAIYNIEIADYNFIFKSHFNYLEYEKKPIYII